MEKKAKFGVLHRFAMQNPKFRLFLPLSRRDREATCSSTALSENSEGVRNLSARGSAAHSQIAVIP